jgi:hypothetical protein
MLTKKYLKAFVLILIFQIILLLIFVFLRLIDFDEGSYLSSAYLVKCGKLPYVDFFFPQMPYLPYVYALVSSYGLSSLYYGRLISLAFGIFLSILIFWFALRLFKDEKLSLSLFFLYGFNGLVLSWHAVVKTLVFSDLFGFISFIFFALYLSSKEKKLNLFWGGFFIGIAFNFRLTFLLILALEGIMIFALPQYESVKKRIVNVLLLISGAVLASGFAIYLFFKNPSAFVFDNIGFHQVWGLEVIKMTFFQKLYTFSKFVFNPQNLFLLILATVSMIWLVKKLTKKLKPTPEDKITIFALSISLVMIVTGFLQEPTEFQYYEQSLPYLLFSSVPVLSRVISKWKDKKFVWRGSEIFYLLSAIPFIVVFIFAIRPKDVPFRIDKTKEVVEVVKQNSSPGEKILSGWPGYVIFAQRESVPGMETFGWAVIHLLSKEEIGNFRLLDRQSISSMILAQKVNMIIADKWFLCDFEELIKPNYHLVGAFEFANVYVRRNIQNPN